MRELRCIIFERSEVIRAITAHRRRIGKPLPPGQIKKLKVEREPEVSAYLHIIPDGGNEMISPSSGAELAASLIAYCIESKVPVPATAKKSITILEGQIALKIMK